MIQKPVKARGARPTQPGLHGTFYASCSERNWNERSLE